MALIQQGAVSTP